MPDFLHRIPKEKKNIKHFQTFQNKTRSSIFYSFNTASWARWYLCMVVNAPKNTDKEAHRTRLGVRLVQCASFFVRVFGVLTTMDILQADL